MTESGRKPWGLVWRSSVGFTTFVVGLGLGVDLLAYSTIIPVFPFRLQELGYNVSEVSALVGWLLFAYSGGIVVFTIPIALLSERYNTRRLPLIFGLCILLGSQVMLMEVPTYWLLCIARVLQGISSSIVFVLGMALLSDVTPETLIGRQFGLAMVGITVGFLVGPPVGGVLYARLGFRAPFIFGEICTLVDLIARLLVIERKDALRWGHDPSYMPTGDTATQDTQQNVVPNETEKNENSEAVGKETTSSEEEVKTHLTLLAVIMLLLKAPRALVALLVSLIYGVMYTAQETVLPLRMQDQFNFDSAKVGLVLLGVALPNLVSAPGLGYLSDRYGSEWATVLCLIFAVPWWIVVAFSLSLPAFVTILALGSLFSSGLLSPLSSELNAVSRKIPGVGYGHVYGAFNLAYGIGNGIGPIIGGQIYAHSSQGWMILNIMVASLLGVSCMLTFFYTGPNPLGKRLLGRRTTEVTTTMENIEAPHQTEHD